MYHSCRFLPSPVFKRWGSGVLTRRKASVECNVMHRGSVSNRHATPCHASWKWSYNYFFVTPTAVCRLEKWSCDVFFFANCNVLALKVKLYVFFVTSIAVCQPEKLSKVFFLPSCHANCNILPWKLMLFVYHHTMPAIVCWCDKLTCIVSVCHHVLPWGVSVLI